VSRVALKPRLLAGEAVTGTFARIPNSELVEIMAHAGFEFVIIDTEHTSFGMETAIELARAADASGIAPLVRVTENAPSIIAKALDIGSQGIVVPRVSTREDAVRAVDAARFHPLGQRGACPRVRAGNYSAMGSVEYFARANDETLLILLVETAEGAMNLPEIVSVPGVDGILLGATDLSQSMGVPGQNYHPEVLAKLAEMSATIRDAGLVLGRVAFSIEEAHAHLEEGTRFLVYSGDETIFYDACRAALTGIRSGSGVLSAG
jgi:4-hydroxy-2-oxoheptanedioate aldolase